SMGLLPDPVSPVVAANAFRCGILLLSLATVPKKGRFKVAHYRGARLRPDSEDEIARKRATGSGHRDLAGGCASWHRGLDFRTRDYIEGCRRAVKADVGRARQIGSQDNDLCSYLAESRQGFYERPEPHIQAK